MILRMFHSCLAATLIVMLLCSCEIFLQNPPADIPSDLGAPDVNSTSPSELPTPPPSPTVNCVSEYSRAISILYDSRWNLPRKNEVWKGRVNHKRV